MQICVLGPLEVHGDATVAVGGVRLRTLLILLALEPGRTVTAAGLVAGLWGDEPPAGATGALQALVSRLRRAVPGLPLESRSGGYRLALHPDAVDAVRFERLALVGQEALRAGDAARAALVLREALALWRGPALADVAEAPFARAAAARLDERRLAALEARIEADLRLGRGAELVAELTELVARYPRREPLTGALMRALEAAGQPGSALDVYERLRVTLADRLGADPSPELRSLHAALLRGDRDRGPSAPGPKALGPTAGVAPTQPRGNLRSALTSFVGRSRDAERVHGRLQDSRLVTLVGPGGAGKTRLAVESARLLAGAPDLPDGVWLVELAPLVSGDALPPAVLSTLGLREQLVMTAMRMRGLTDADPTARLVAALAGRRLLLVLGNCEHLLDAAAALAEEVLGGCPEVRVLATSREPLGITGETLWPVGPLALPPADLDGSARSGPLAGYPAVRLFVDRATAVRPGFSLDGAGAGATAAAVLRICRALDGMPLAIELAAARLRAMTPEQVAARLDDRFRLLASGSRTALPRHRTLEAVVAWSWDLLEAPERVLWRRLAIFPGGVTGESARAVCADPAAGPDPPDRVDPAEIADLLTALVEKSLLVCDESDGGAQPRYRQLDTIRAYGLRRLDEAGERERMRAAHGAHFLELAETADPKLRGRDQVDWLRRLAGEQDNLHAALRGAVAAGDAATAVRMSAALGWYWWVRGHRVEGAELAGAALDVPGEAPAGARMLAGTMAALNAFDGFQDLDTASARLRSAIAGGTDDDVLDSHPLLPLLSAFRVMLAEGLGPGAIDSFRACFDLADPWARSTARILFAYLSINAGVRYDEAEQAAEEALVTFEALGERWGIAFAHGARGELAELHGDGAIAVACFRKAAALSAELFSHEDVCQFQMNLAGAVAAQGDLGEARRLLGEARLSAEIVGSPDLLAGIDLGEGDIARLEGDLALARTLVSRAADRIEGRLLAPQFRALICIIRAYVEVAEGRLEPASHLLAMAMAEAERSTDAPVIARVLVAVADFAVRTGFAEKATVLLGASATVRRARDADVRRVETAARAALGERAFAEATARGRAIPLEQLPRLADLTRDV